MASADVAMAKAKAAKAINLIISFLPCEPSLLEPTKITAVSSDCPWF
jgi:hypothetical protein